MKYNSKRKVRRDRTEIAAEVIAVLLSLVFISLVIIPVLNTISVALSSGSAETAGKVLLLPVDFQLTTIKAIIFDTDYFGNHRGIHVLPGPFANAEDAGKKLFLNAKYKI